MKSKDQKEKKTKTAMEAAAAYLANRMHTIAEVRRHLADKGYSCDEADDAVNTLIGMHYLDDYQYALRYYEYNREKHRGTLRAERELSAKGVDQEIIRNAREDYLYEQQADEFEDALAAARKLVYVPSDIYGEDDIRRELDDRLTAKIARKLEAAGFSRSDIFRVLDALRREGRD